MSESHVCSNKKKKYTEFDPNCPRCQHDQKKLDDYFVLRFGQEPAYSELSATWDEGSRRLGRHPGLSSIDGDWSENAVD